MKAKGWWVVFHILFVAGASSFLSGQEALQDSIGASLPLSKCFQQKRTCVYVCLNTVIWPELCIYMRFFFPPSSQRSIHALALHDFWRNKNLGVPGWRLRLLLLEYRAKVRLQRPMSESESEWRMERCHIFHFSLSVSGEVWQVSKMRNTFWGEVSQWRKIANMTQWHAGKETGAPLTQRWMTSWEAAMETAISVQAWVQTSKELASLTALRCLEAWSWNKNLKI